MSNLSPKKMFRRKIISPLREFISDSRSVGITLICCTIISLLLANSAWSDQYIGFWEHELHMPAPGIHLPHTVLHIINDALMAIFFFLVGLEIKRELLIGELASVKKSMLPIFGAIGGMAVPAMLYLAWTVGEPEARGWGIPMATDIAFSLGILSLLGNRAPMSLRIFLAALAIIDDLGGILTIAIFYAGEIKWYYLLLAGAILLLLALLNVFKQKRLFFYFLPGVLLWYFIFNSGVHATIAGVLLAFTIPLDEIEKLEHAFHDPVNFLIMPVFALANTAILLPDDISTVFTSTVHHGIATGLVLGKPLGILLFCFLAVRLGIAVLPAGIKWQQILGIGMVAGVGFTISIFMSTLAFSDPQVQTTAKVAVMVASLVAALSGFLYLRMLNNRTKRV